MVGDHVGDHAAGHWIKFFKANLCKIVNLCKFLRKFALCKLLFFTILDSKSRAIECNFCLLIFLEKYLIDINL